MEARSPRKDLVAAVSFDVGLLIQAFADFEVSVDDLICLVDDRTDGRHELGERYPVQISAKLEALADIAPLFPGEFTETTRQEIKSIPERMERHLELRNCLVHGRIHSIQGSGGSYRLTVSKLSRPSKIKPKLFLLKRHSDIVFEKKDFVAAHLAVGDAKRVVSIATECVFKSGDGWPRYLFREEELVFGDLIRDVSGAV